MKITNQALHHVYLLANQHKAKTGILELHELFNAIEPAVNEFETQVGKMGAEGKILEEKSQNTSFTVKEREKYKAELDALQSQFEIVHSTFVDIDVSVAVAKTMNVVLEKAIEEEKIVGRRLIKNTVEALDAITETVVAINK